jgi:hypothetical protein
MIAILARVRRATTVRRSLSCIAGFAVVGMGAVVAGQTKYGVTVYPKDYTVRHIAGGTVLPFRLTKKQSTIGIRMGELFVADLETSDVGVDPRSLSTGATLEGHINFIRRRKGDSPGVIGVVFNRLRMPDGHSYRLAGTLIGMDSNSVERQNGRWVALPKSQSSGSKDLHRGPAGEALIPLVTKGHLVSDKMIGNDPAELKRHKSRYSDVDAEAGSKFGVLLTHDLKYYAGPKWHAY